MLTLIGWGVFIGVLWYLGCRRAAPKLWLGSAAILFIIYSYFQIFSLPILIILGSLWFLMVLLSLVSPWRRRLISTPLLNWFQKQQPTLSDAEKQLLAAGGLWWEAQFFSGKPNWQEIIATPKPKLTIEEQEFLDHQVDTLCQMLNDWDIIQEGDLSKQAWDYIKQERFWGLVTSKTFGGLGFSALAHSAIITKIATRSTSAAITVMVPNSLGPAEFLERYGSREQQDYYLPRLVKGEEIPCFALTSPQAGSDATSIIDTGIICRREFSGKTITGILLNFEKRYITLAPITTLIGLAFKLYDPDHLLGETTDIGITLALVPANLPGVEIGERHNPLGLAFMNGPIKGRDVFIPLDYMIGGVERCGEGWQMMMECLAVGRGISLPALATACGQLCFRTSGAYAKIREQFKRSIGDFEGVQEALARIGGLTYICEATRLATAQAVASGARPAITSAIAKYHLTELSRKIVDDAMDIHAGRGIQLGKRNYLGLLHRSIPISITVEGANILTRNLIIFGQGLMRCHPFLQHEIAVGSEPDTQVKQKKFDHIIFRHIGFSLSLLLRTIAYGVSRGRFIKSPKKGCLAKHYRQLTRMSCAFALLTEVALAVLGKQIKLKEALSARLGDVMSQLYLATTVLQYYNVQDKQDEDLLLVNWSLAYCLNQMHQAIKSFLVNFPIKWIARLLDWIIFPWDRAYSCPLDHMGAKIALMMQQNSELRERLTQYCFIGGSDDAPVARMEHAMQAIIAAEPIIEKLSIEKLSIDDALSKNIITDKEAELLKRAFTLREEALQVDAF